EVFPICFNTDHHRTGLVVIADLEAARDTLTARPGPCSQPGYDARLFRLQQARKQIPARGYRGHEIHRLPPAATEIDPDIAAAPSEDFHWRRRRPHVRRQSGAADQSGYSDTRNQELVHDGPLSGINIS